METDAQVHVLKVVKEIALPAALVAEVLAVTTVVPIVVMVAKDALQHVKIIVLVNVKLHVQANVRILVISAHIAVVPVVLKLVRQDAMAHAKVVLVVLELVVVLVVHHVGSVPLMEHN